MAIRLQPMIVGVCATVLLSVAVSAQAGERNRPAKDPLANRAMVNAGFLGKHPDLRNRNLGLAAHGRGDNEQALRYFRRASYFGDKTSQAVVAEMYWNGWGTGMDRAMAYVWMDLAAERGWPIMLARRESAWEALTPGERERALAEGVAVYARYGDDVAKPRINSQLRRGQLNTTGSRTGFAGSLMIYTAIPGTMMSSLESDGSSMPAYATIDGSEFYDRDYWEPARYHDWQERRWEQTMAGRVQAGPLQPVKKDAPVGTESENDAPGNDP